MVKTMKKIFVVLLLSFFALVVLSIRIGLENRELADENFLLRKALSSKSITYLESELKVCFDGIDRAQEFVDGFAAAYQQCDQQLYACLDKQKSKGCR